MRCPPGDVKCHYTGRLSSATAHCGHPLPKSTAAAYGAPVLESAAEPSCTTMSPCPSRPMMQSPMNRNPEVRRDPTCDRHFLCTANIPDASTDCSLRETAESFQACTQGERSLSIEPAGVISQKAMGYDLNADDQLTAQDMQSAAKYRGLAPSSAVTKVADAKTPEDKRMYRNFLKAQLESYKAGKDAGMIGRGGGSFDDRTGDYLRRNPNATERIQMDMAQASQNYIQNLNAAKRRFQPMGSQNFVDATSTREVVKTYTREGASTGDVRSRFALGSRAVKISGDARNPLLGLSADDSGVG